VRVCVERRITPMPTNLQLDDRLIGEAVKLGGHTTKKDAVNQALSEYVQQLKQKRYLLTTRTGCTRTRRVRADSVEYVLVGTSTAWRVHSDSMSPH